MRYAGLVSIFLLYSCPAIAANTLGFRPIPFYAQYPELTATIVLAALITMGCFAGFLKAKDKNAKMRFLSAVIIFFLVSIGSLPAHEIYTKIRFYNSVRKLAEQGVANSQRGLGEMYLSGNAVFQSYEDAYFWLSLAALRSYNPEKDTTNYSHLSPVEKKIAKTIYNSGLLKIRENIEKAASHLDASQKALIDKRIAEWKPTPPQLFQRK